MKEHNSSDEANTIFWIEISKICPNPQQPRREFDDRNLRELADSIKQYGILQPLVVTRKETEIESGTLVEYELISGERRLRASKMAGLFQVPVIIRKESAEKIKLELALIENIQREDLNPVELARAFKQLIAEFNIKPLAIAVKIGKSREYVSNTMRLLNLPEQMLASLAKKEILEGHTRPLLMLSERPEQQKALYEDILSRKIGIREAEQIARKIAYERARKKDDLPYIEETRLIERSLANLLGTRVFIDRKGETGKILIDFHSANQLAGLYKFIAAAKEKEFFKNEDLNAARRASDEFTAENIPERDGATGQTAAGQNAALINEESELLKSATAEGDGKEALKEKAEEEKRTETEPVYFDERQDAAKKTDYDWFNEQTLSEIVKKEDEGVPEKSLLDEELKRDTDENAPRIAENSAELEKLEKELSATDPTINISESINFDEPEQDK